VLIAAAVVGPCLAIAVAPVGVPMSRSSSGVGFEPGLGSIGSAAARNHPPPSVVDPAHRSPAPPTSIRDSFGVDEARAALVERARQAIIDNGGNLSEFLPPNLNAAPGPPSQTGNHVVPLYDYAAAPLGISTLGLENNTGTTTPYILNTTSLEGTFSAGTDPLGLKVLSPYYGSLQSYGDQLNSVLNNTTVYGKAAYDYWLQNVITYSDSTHTLSFENNIWNFSSSSGAFPFTSILHGLGAVESGVVYAASGPSIVVAFPFTLDLYLNSTVGSYLASPLVNEVFFNYTIINDNTHKVVCPGTEPSGEACGMYDNVYFNSRVPVAPGSAEIQANGEQYTPIGLPSDMEMDVGVGQSDGANANVVYANATVGLFYLNATADTYQSPPSTYDFGSETGETGQGGLTTWNTVDGRPVAYFRTGPSLLTGLWNVSGPTDGAPTIGFEQAGAYALNCGGVVPGNAFVAVAPGSGVTNQSYFQVAPTFGWFTGRGRIGQNLWLSPGSYTVEVLLSGYAPVNQTVVMTSNQSLSVSLSRQTAPTVYTPLWAYTNSDLANLSTSGAGTLASPYVLPGAQTGSIAPVFAILNDYLFIIYSGIWINATTAYFQFNPPPSLEVTEPSWWYPEIDRLSSSFGGILTYNQLPMFFYHTSNFVVENGTGIGLWSSDVAVGDDYAVYCDVCSNSLFAGNYFNVSSAGLDMLGSGTKQHNYIWGNTFAPFEEPGAGSQVRNSTYGGMSAPWTGLTIGEAADHIFNNVFYTNQTVTSATSLNYYNATGGYLPASDAIVVDGARLSGSILGEAFQGGNYYRDYGALPNPYGVTPYVSRASSPTGAAGIGKGGDTSPLAILPGSCAALCRPNAGLYHLIFTGTGLSLGKSWTVKVFGVPVYEPLTSTLYTTNPTNTSTTNTSAFWLPNGTYSWEVSTVPTGCISTCVATPENGTITVNGTAPAGVSVAFGEGFAQIVVESGLPIGMTWWFNVTGRVAISATVSGGLNTITDVLPNGTYTYAIAATPNWNVSTDSGSGTDIIADAAPPEIFVTFGGAYRVSFREDGLPSGLTWEVTLASLSMNLTTDGQTDRETFAEPDGTFAYTISDVAGWHQTTLSYNGNVGVNGSSVSEPTLVYSQLTYSVTFSESGLPSGEAFRATVNGAPEAVTTDGLTDTLVFAEPNGTFAYSIGDVPGWHQATLAYTGNVTLDGIPVAEPTLTYSTVTYSAKVSESGLPSGVTFEVTVNGDSSNLTTDGLTDSLTFPDLPNGTYPYSIAGISGWHQTTLAYTGDVRVAGAFVTEPTLIYSPVTYSVTFAEGGLPSGLDFEVTVNGVPEHLTTDGATDTQTWSGLPNGTYAYSVADISGWHQPTLSYSGNVMVEAAAVTEPTLEFVAVEYSVTFSQTGLPPGTEWWINVTPGTSSDSVGTSLSVSLGNGTFAYTAASANGSYAARGGSLTVHGVPVLVEVTFGLPSNPPAKTFLGLPGAAGYWVLAGVVALGLILAFLLVDRGRKEKDKERLGPPAGVAPTRPRQPPPP